MSHNNKPKPKTAPPREPWDVVTLTPRLRMWLNRIYEPLKDHLTIEKIKKLIIDNHYNEEMIEMAMNELFENIGDASEWKVAERRSGKGVPGSTPVATGYSHNNTNGSSQLNNNNGHDSSHNNIGRGGSAHRGSNRGRGGNGSSSRNNTTITNSTSVTHTGKSNSNSNNQERRPYRGGRSGRGGLGGQDFHHQNNNRYQGASSGYGARGGGGGNRHRKSNSTFGHDKDSENDEDPRRLLNTDDDDVDNLSVNITTAEEVINNVNSNDPESSSSVGEEPRKPTWADRLKRPETPPVAVLEESPPPAVSPQGNSNARNILTDHPQQISGYEHQYEEPNVDISSQDGYCGEGSQLIGDSSTHASMPMVPPPISSMDPPYQQYGGHNAYNSAYSPTSLHQRGGLWNQDGTALSDEVAASYDISSGTSAGAAVSPPPGIGAEEPKMYSECEITEDAPVDPPHRQQHQMSPGASFHEVDNNIVPERRPSSPINAMNSPSLVPAPVIPGHYPPGTAPVGVAVGPPHPCQLNQGFSPFAYDVVGSQHHMMMNMGGPRYMHPAVYNPYVHQLPPGYQPAPGQVPQQHPASTMGGLGMTSGYYQHAPPLPMHPPPVVQQPAQDDSSGVVVDHRSAAYSGYPGVGLQPGHYGHHQSYPIPSYAAAPTAGAPGGASPTTGEMSPQATYQQHQSAAQTGVMYSHPHQQVQQQQSTEEMTNTGAGGGNSQRRQSAGNYGMYNMHNPTQHAPSAVPPTMEAPIIGLHHPHHSVHQQQQHHPSGYYYYPPTIDNSQLGGGLPQHQLHHHGMNSNNIIQQSATTTTADGGLNNSAAEVLNSNRNGLGVGGQNTNDEPDDRR